MFTNCDHRYRFFNSLARSIYTLTYSLSFIFTLWSARTAKFTRGQVFFFFFFLLINIGSDLLTGIGQFVCIWESNRILWNSFSTPHSVLCIYHFQHGRMHSSQWITFPTQSYLLLYSFHASLPHSLIS